MLMNGNEVNIYCAEIGVINLLEFHSQGRRVPAVTLFHRTLVLARICLLGPLLEPLFTLLGRLPNLGPGLSLLA